MQEVTVAERWLPWNGIRYRVWERPAPGTDTPPLVLIHGYAACVEQWGRFIRDIGPDVPVFAVELIGFGASDKPRNAPYGRAFSIGQLEHLRASYGWEKIVAVGHSLGGMFAIEWAAEFPDVVTSVIAIAPGGLLEGDPFKPHQRRALAVASTPAITRLVYAFVTHLPYRILSAPAYADRAAMDPYTQVAIKSSLHTPGAAWSFSALARHPEAFQIAANAHTVRCPMHILRGSKDAQVSEQDTLRLKARFPQATITVFDGGGHCVHEERAREVTAEVRTVLVTDGLLHPVPVPFLVTI